MRLIYTLSAVALAAAGMLPAYAAGDEAAYRAALAGLVPFSTLENSAAGKAALAANLQITGAIQAGTEGQPLLLSFAQQQAQALRDAFITGGDAAELADGLGTKLGVAYQALASYSDAKTFTNASPSVANLIAYTAKLTGADSNAGKYFFSNGTTDGKTPVDPITAAILTKAGGEKDVLGRAYDDVSGPKADPYGDPRPFQTEPKVTMFGDPDYFGKPSDNDDYLDGPAQNLKSSPAFPSGHTTYGYTESLLLAYMVPERFAQMITRAAEYGNDRIVLGAHYTMDVLGGRTLAYYDVAHLLANDPSYLGRKEKSVTPITDYPAALQVARIELRHDLKAQCGAKLVVCATEDTGRFSNAAANEAFYESTQTYGLPVVYPQNAGKIEDVGTRAPQAGYLLKAAFPFLSLVQADKILTATEGPGGGFLDDGSAFGVYSRLDLYKASLQARADAPHKS